MKLSEHLENKDINKVKEFKKLFKFINNLDYVNWEDQSIDDLTFSNIWNLTEKKCNGEDITFDIGYKYFRGNTIKLEQGVFVPQFDTEPIIDIVRDKCKAISTALEIGTGTGAISIALAKELNIEVTAIDINKDATILASENALLNNITINILNEDLFEYEPLLKYELLISNPPYIDVNDTNVEQWVKDNQPKEALYAEDNGYKFYKYILDNYNKYLISGGYILFEIGYNQSKDISTYALKKGHEVISIYKDLDNINDRFVLIKTKED